MRKSKFFTFILAMLPGAGQMYQGFMKRGVSLMITFFSVIAFAVLTNLGELCAVLPVIWFFAFFDCMNKSSYTIEELSVIEDKMIFDFKFSEEYMGKYTQQRNIFAGWVIILLGVLILYNSIIRSYLWRLERYLPGIGGFADKLPALILSIVVILVGIRLIKGSGNEKAGEGTNEE